MHENLVRISAVSRILEGLQQPYVFVGGATVSLYASEPIVAEHIRPTDDVDVVIELASYAGYAQIDERLRDIGFVNDVESGVLCRYRVHGIIVDIMPTDSSVIGFSNRWYPDAFRQAVPRMLYDGTEVLIFSLPYFVASKWEAFLSRGKGDYRMSKDFEDLVYIFQHCRDFQGQMAIAPGDVMDYLRNELGNRINSVDFEEGILCHMEGGYYGVDVVEIISKVKLSLNMEL
ncbi:nucleotidyl transferase AbiEii/AbiGii toxin family protein [Parapedobacter tibetensis]|uniref:nucleotidyl transferase AbiEii/AbiGii toxin family protein n=1 Tax=Parapedobacter tibetensis TaxID=2972951 RepID=UPI00214DE3FE|nr:nucleotidyl transferase AbiEii/AbiGii toxin family protein [Parapedobacter tibetensis]